MKSKLSIFSLALMLLITTAWANDKPDKRLLHTSAFAEIKGDNDSAYMQVSINTENKYLETAHKQNAVKAAAVTAALKKLNVKGLKIKTANYHIYPQRNYKNKQQEIIGYKIQNTLALTIEELPEEKLSLTVSKLLDTALKHGANQISAINFYIKDQQPLVNKALSKATKIAISKARTLAKAANVTLGPLYQITSDAQQMAVPRTSQYSKRRSMLKAAAAPATPIEAGESKITATVSVSYEIK